MSASCSSSSPLSIVWQRGKQGERASTVNPNDSEITFISNPQGQGKKKKPSGYPKQSMAITPKSQLKFQNTKYAPIMFSIYYELTWWLIGTGIFFLNRWGEFPCLATSQMMWWTKEQVRLHPYIHTYGHHALKGKQRESKILHLWNWGNINKSPVLAFSHKRLQVLSKGNVSILR